jgi:hypothetical protein
MVGVQRVFAELSPVDLDQVQIRQDLPSLWKVPRAGGQLDFPRYLLCPLMAVACLDAGMLLAWRVAVFRASRVIGGVLRIDALMVLKRVRQAGRRVGDGLVTWRRNVRSGLATRVCTGISAMAVGQVLELAH